VCAKVERLAREIVASPGLAFRVQRSLVLDHMRFREPVVEMG
jgi:hypothetical protein